MRSSPDTLAIATALALTLGGFGQAAIADAQPALNLSVESPAGQHFNLAYRGGDGWRSSAGSAQPMKIALAKTPAASGKAIAVTEQPLAVVLDRPTGGTFVYLPEQGWKFAGRSDAAKPMKTALATKSEPLTMFVDGPTGFTYTYAPGTGWKYVGRVGDRKL